jgi:WD repeat-containing protein 19
LYLALGNFQQAAKTAVIIARQEQDLGNYKEAHAILFETIRQLEDQRAHVPQALRRSFVLLHSYTLVKRLAKRGDHEGAARMLLRVAKSISKFPTHTVPVLTSTVIECQRAGLRNSAFEYATMLMRQEYRGQVKCTTYYYHYCSINTVPISIGIDAVSSSHWITAVLIDV